jgi:hypothetical protein
MQLQLFVPENLDETDKWVSRLNKLAADMDETASSLHPSAWPETLGALNAKWKTEAAK